MLSVRNEIDIAAPVEEVFAYMDEPQHQVALTPSLVRFDLLERLPNGGCRVEYSYQVCGISFSGEVEATDYVPDHRIVWSVNGNFQGTLRWYFAAAGENRTRTRFTYAATYAAPGLPLLQPVLAPLLHWYNKRETRTLMERLQRRLESKAAEKNM